jgi:hypothetical protein
MFFGRLASGTLNGSNDWLVSLDLELIAPGDTGITTVTAINNASFSGAGIVANTTQQTATWAVNYATTSSVLGFNFTVTKTGSAPNILGTVAAPNLLFHETRRIHP